MDPHPPPTAAAASTTEPPGRPPKRFLEPVERVSEILFGLIMVLTFTGSLSVAETGREEIRTMLIGALGCNLAWGVIDAVLYLMGCMAERGRGLRTLHAVRGAADPQNAHRLIAGALPPLIASITLPAELEALRQRLTQMPRPPERPRLRAEDWLGAMAVFFWVFISMFPVAVPFLFMHSPAPALRVSNAIAVIMLFLCGYRLAKESGNRPWLMGLAMAVLGSALVGMTIALGG